MTAKKKRGIIEFLYVLPFIILVGIFCYYPLYGWRYAFYDYKPPKPLSESAFVGLKWFKYTVDNPVRIKNTLEVLRNTFAMSGIALAFSWFPMFLAIFINEMKCKPFKKFVQTVTTLPNFISWVLVFAIAFSIFSTSGAVNTTLLNLGVFTEPKDFLSSDKHVYFTQWLWMTWKNAGWTSIMYIAAITGIDEQLIEAAKVDGANRMKIIWHVTIPSILPTFFVIVMLNISNFLNNGMEQYYVFQNSFNKSHIQVLDLYVYNLKGTGAYSLSTALSILKSIVSLVLLGISNMISKAVRGSSFV